MTNFVEDWFNNPNWWFNCTNSDDEYISKKYGNLYLEQYKLCLTEETHLELILINDQLVRHLVRTNLVDKIEIDIGLNRSLDICNTIYKYNLHKPAYLDWVQWCFTMLPYRHSNNVPKMHEMLKIAWGVLDNENNDFHTSDTAVDINNTNIIKRFIKATYKTLVKFNNVEKSPQIEKSLTFAMLYECKKICEYMPEYTLIENQIDEDKDETVKEKLKDDIIISLSGGVDSMVCAYNYSSKVQNLTALFINYNNRESSETEVKFLKAWTTINNITLYIRNIYEINRKQCMKHNMRELYESYTKQVRFNSYKDVNNIINNGKKNVSECVCDASELIPTVVLGHHQGDLLENSLTNIVNGKKFEDIVGMEEIRIVDGVRFIRPLINTNKKEIINYAKRNNIPFLEDSTPSWSTRGKIRDCILPGIDNWVGIDKAAEGFIKLSESCKEASQIINSYIAMFSFDNQDLPLDTLPTVALVYRRLFAKKFNVFPSNKSIRTLIEKIEYMKRTKHDMKFEVCKDFQLIFKYKENNIVNVNHSMLISV